MTCPKCGDRRAECIIGAFWKCPTCDAAPKKPAESLTSSLAWTIAQVWPQKRVNDYMFRATGFPTITGQLFRASTPDVETAWWQRYISMQSVLRASRDARTFVDFVELHVARFVDFVSDDLIPKVRGARIETMGPFPQWVTDDGQIMVRINDFDDAEIRMRAIWRVV